MALPQRLAKRKGTRLAVFLDEFQEIRTLGGPALEKAMRAAFQQQPLVSNVFAGSKESLMWEMAHSPRAPFYRSGRTLALGPIAAEEFKAYLAGKFAASGMHASSERLDDVLTLGQEIPFNVQYLCHALWVVMSGQGEIEPGDLDRAVAYILAAENEYYSALWDQLTLHQRRTLRALARSGGAAPFILAFLREYDLRPSASVARSLGRLLKREVVKKTRRESTGSPIHSSGSGSPAGFSEHGRSAAA